MTSPDPGRRRFGRVSLQPGFVLHRRPYRDTSLLLELFVAEQGRISAVAKGARGRSRRGSQSALLQPFAPLLVSYTGRSELKTLTATESASPALPLMGESLYSGMYLNELLVRLLHRYDPHPRLFAAYCTALERLSAGQPAAAALRAFELLLLEEMGYSFSLHHDAATGSPVEGNIWYRYEAGRGLCAVEQSEQGGGGFYRGRDLLAMAAGEFEGDIAPVAKRLLRSALAEHLGDEPLRSRELFRRHAGRAISPTGDDQA